MAPRRVWAMASARRWSPAARGRGAVIFMCGPMSMCSWAMAPSAAPGIEDMSWPACSAGLSPGAGAATDPRAMAAAAAVTARAAARTRANEWREGCVDILRFLLFLEHRAAHRPAARLLTDYPADHLWWGHPVR